jgi:hypothetical protein
MYSLPQNGGPALYFPPLACCLHDIPDVGPMATEPSTLGCKGDLQNPMMVTQSIHVELLLRPLLGQRSFA